jgi:hypothetical protein
MPKLALSIATAAALAVVVAAVALAGAAGNTHTYRATMTTGSEVPKPKAPAGARGAFTATVTSSGSTRTISWKLTFRGLSGKAVGAHIHKGKAGVAGAVLVPLCGPCRSGQTGKLKISKSTADLLERGGAYDNVHTAKNAAGEVRGQLKLLDDHATTTTSDQGTTTTDDPGYPPPPPGY